VRSDPTTAVARGGWLAAGYRAAVTAYAPASAPTALIGQGQEAAYPQLADGTLGYLAGDWDVVREIADHRTGVAGSFRGRASFRPGPAAAAEPAGLDGHVLDFAEHGELKFGAHRGPASRSLRYHGRSDGCADVRFADDREFYRLDLRSGSCRAVHPCGPDRYAVTVTWLSDDSFTEVWQVTGPAKDYDLTSVYTRAGCTS
jgi:Family of unknown function (DUF6314)